jgi:hypothetical protein
VADFLDLFGEDPVLARQQAQALADAMGRRRAAGTVASIIGGPFAQAGKEFLGGADQTQQELARAGFFRGQQGLRRQEMGQSAAQHQAALAAHEAAQAETGRYHSGQLGLEREKLGLMREEKGKKKTSDATKAAEDLRKEFQAGQTYKNTQLIAESAKKIISSSDTGAGDMSLLYGYMKLLDPGSAVRESEFATAAQSGSLPQQIQGWASKIISGERLPASTRKQFKDEARNIVKAQTERYEETAKPYRRLAETAGVRPEDVILDLGLQGLLADPAAAAGLDALPHKTIGGKTYEKFGPNDADWRVVP